MPTSNETIRETWRKESQKLYDENDYIPTKIIADWWISHFDLLLQEKAVLCEKEMKEIGHVLSCKMCSPKCGFNSGLQTAIKIFME